MDKHQLLQFVDELPLDDKEFYWKWFGTLDFPEPISLQSASKNFYTWKRELEQFEGWKTLNLVHVMECSSVGVRFHVVAGGLKIADKWQWIVRWHELGGSGSLTYCFRPGIILDHLRSTCRSDSAFDMLDAFGGSGWHFPAAMYRNVVVRGCCIGAVGVCQKWPTDLVESQRSPKNGNIDS